MTHIRLQNVSLSFPLRGVDATSVRPSRRGQRSERGRVIVAKGQKRVQALTDVSLHVVDGERVGVVGSNGSGKSTLMRTVAGIYRPHAGRVEIQGEIDALFSLGFGMRMEASGYENILMRAYMRGIPHDVAVTKMEEIAAFADVGEYINLPIRTYSQGMSMRLFFAAATAFHPDVLILDEWIGAGDAKFRDKAAERMRNFVQESGILIIASHNNRILLEVCTRGVWMRGGRVHMSGSIEEVVEAYNEFLRRQNRAPEAGSEARRRRLERQPAFM